MPHNIVQRLLILVAGVSLPLPVLAHDASLGDQMLQPVTAAQSLLPLLAVGLTALLSGPAAAQLVVDGNLVFNNGNTGTVAGQFAGAPTGASLTLCNTNYSNAAYSAVQLGTVTFTHNFYADPLLPNAAYPNTRPNFQPLLGSPAYTQAMTVPSDGFFQQVCYVGAIGPDPADDWTQGWT